MFIQIGFLVFTLLIIMLIHYDLPSWLPVRAGRATQGRPLSGSELLFNDGRAACWQRRYRDAIRMLRQAALIRPERAMTHYYLGLSWLALGNFAEAEKAWQEALRHDPENNLARNGLEELVAIQNRRSTMGQASDGGISLCRASLSAARTGKPAQTCADTSGSRLIEHPGRTFLKVNRLWK
ncbi:MAG: tetratricopeptide repeat protein [Blastocatellia bacterium]